ncbi:MAG: hypothetical protein IT406_02090 [Candidatus Yanofskybacteria bacterium]|nr:hypothetical protein [Candidatus Yanofskybacteria bacterium]
MEDPDDPEVEAAVLTLLEEAIANLKQAVAETARQCGGISEHAALERLQANLPQAMLLDAKQAPDETDDVQFAYFVLNLAFDAVRASLSN